jgi:hypothetical protein
LVEAPINITLAHLTVHCQLAVLQLPKGFKYLFHVSSREVPSEAAYVQLTRACVLLLMQGQSSARLAGTQA